MLRTFSAVRHGLGRSSFAPMPWTMASRSMCAAEAQNVLGDLVVTPRCAKKILELRKKNEESREAVLRVLVEGGGCSGFQYKFEFRPDEPDEDDHIFERDGARVLVDDVSLEFIRGATLDYAQELIRSSFAIVNNPNSEASCGCGTSFALKEDAA